MVSSRVFYLGITLAMLFVVGCGGSSPNSNSQPSPGDKLTSVPPPLSPSPSSPEPMLALPKSTDAPAAEEVSNAPVELGELLGANRNFEDNPDDARFRPWEIVRWQNESGQVQRVAAPDGGEGNLSVEFKGGDSEIQYRISPVPADLAGKNVVCSIDGLAGAPDQLVVQLKAISGEQDVWLNEVRHPGDATWQKLEFAATVPADKLPGALLLRVIANSKGRDGSAFPADASVMVDNVSLRAKQEEATDAAAAPSAPAILASAQLLKYNRGFEDAPGDQNFLPWKIVRWTKDAGKAVRIDASDSAEGKLSLELTGGNVEVFYEVTELPEGASGQEITASVDGVAFAPEQLTIQLKGKAGDKEIWLNEASHSGSGRWETMTLKANLPVDAPLDSLTLRVMRQSKNKSGKAITAKGKVVIDNASLVVGRVGTGKAAPATASAPKASPLNLFVSNGGFEDSPDQNHILPWQIVRHVKDAGEVKRVKGEKGAVGAMSVELTGPNVEITRSAPADASFARANVAASVEGIAYAPRQLVLQVKYRVKDKDKDEWLFQAEHPGDGQWHKIENNRTIPADIVPDEIIVRILRNPVQRQDNKKASKGRVIVDDAKLLVTKAN